MRRLTRCKVGALQLPGGHLNFGETPAACAAREVFEEAGLTISEGDIHFVTATNDIFEREGKHYVTLFMACRVSDDVQARVRRLSRVVGAAVGHAFVQRLELYNRLNK